jgi:hypothetical protein
MKDSWIHLRLLADFMEIGTHPERWHQLKSTLWGLGNNEDERTARLERIKVCRLDYYDTERIESAKFDSTCESRAAEILAQDLDLDQSDPKVQFRLYVVEDLSSDVIEILGSNLGIEPSFFRAHLTNYDWYNVRDRWRDPPEILTRQHNWIELRYTTARYFETRSDFDAAAKEAESFNILRRLDDDMSNTSWWDDKNAVVGLIKSKATLWLKPKPGTRAIGEETKLRTEIVLILLGVLLLDPTIRQGNALWRGHRNWLPTPDPNSPAYTWDLGAPQGPKFYDDFLYWAQKPGAFSTSLLSSTSMVHVPIQVLLQLICSEWLTMIDYIKTRLNQIELELGTAREHSQINVDLTKLHLWRRLVSTYREMLTESLEQMSNLPPHAANMFSSPSDSTSIRTDSHGECILHRSADAIPCPLNVFYDEFNRLLSKMKECQKRVEHLTSIITAVISMNDFRRGQEDSRSNKGVAQLTWLAAFYVPLNFISSLFSMQGDVSGLDGTFKLYFRIAIPLAVGGLILALLFVRVKQT